MTGEEFISKVEEGEPFRIDFMKREVWLDGSVVSVDFCGESSEEKLLELFRNYKFSVPSAKADSRYFYAHDETKLSTRQLAENEPRYVARARLEIYVLGLITKGAWDFGDGWYWQSKREPKLVLFKKWF